MLQYITNRKQAIYTNFLFWRLAVGTFRNALSRMSIEGIAHELPATRDRRPGHPGTGFLCQRDWSSQGAPRDPADLERRHCRSRGADAPAEPLQDRPRHRPL